MEIGLHAFKMNGIAVTDYPQQKGFIQIEQGNKYIAEKYQNMENGTDAAAYVWIYSSALIWL